MLGEVELDGRRIFFRPDEPLSFDATYDVTMEACGSQEFSFHTSSWSEPASMAEPALMDLQGISSAEFRAVVAEDGSAWEAGMVELVADARRVAALGHSFPSRGALPPGPTALPPAARCACRRSPRRSPDCVGTRAGGY
ncbi:MAG TPA: hypothetical protein QGF58_23720 [Myxococcota bacterium]|nr:hypothetical protein [Myxococcota bacterium]